MTRRNALVISVMIGVGVGILVLTALLPTRNPGDVSVDTNPAISELLPPRDDTVLPQANVGAILTAGWAGEILHIGGTVIPLDQQRIQKALNSIIFRPDEGLRHHRLVLPGGRLSRTPDPVSAGQLSGGQQAHEGGLVQGRHPKVPGPGRLGPATLAGDQRSGLRRDAAR